jgi:hypothetical protein
MEPLIPVEDKENKRENEEEETAFVEGEDNEGLDENLLDFEKQLILDDSDVNLNNTKELENLEEVFHSNMEDKRDFIFNEFQFQGRIQHVI